MNKTLEKKEDKFYQGIEKVANTIDHIPGSVRGDALDIMCPLKHTFVDGAYVREIFMPKGTLIISKIHKWKHPYFVIQGDASVLTEDGVVRIKAPYAGITERGTQRILFMHEDTKWITVHATKEKDLDKIESEIIVKDYRQLSQEEKDQLPEYIEEAQIAEFAQEMKEKEGEKDD